MSRPVKVLFPIAVFALAALLGACGTEKVSVPPPDVSVHEGAVLFNQRCGGCHTFSYAGTHGSAQNVRTAQFNNGPNFDVRCERPVARVLYAIQNGGFSGAIMPQNIVVGQQARDVAQFVATYSGRKAPKVPGVVPCQQVPVGTIEAALATPPTATTSTTSTGPSQGTVTGTSSPTQQPSSGSAANGQVVTISSRKITGLGRVLVNISGRTLYVFARDAHSKVTCTGTCAAVWPPVVLPPGGHAIGTNGVQQSLLGEAPNPAGGKVVTYAGWPLYTYVGDQHPGSISGQDLNLNGGFWWVITPAGRVITAKPH